MACVCGHAIEEHDPECHGTYTFEGKVEDCCCLGYEEDEEDK